MGLTNSEIMKIVNRYIGVYGGYLGDFSYRTHADFYVEYCDLEIDPYQYEGTTRERFINILQGSPADVQAKIIRGVLERFPLTTEKRPITRTPELFAELMKIAIRLESNLSVPSPNLKTTSVIIERSINDVEILIQSNSPISGVDRIHTSLYGYLQAVCDDANIQYDKEDGMAKLFKLLRQNHPALQNLGPKSREIERVFQSFSIILDALNPIRNNMSVAHPNKDLLEKDEALLVINVARTILNYLDAKFG